MRFIEKKDIERLERELKECKDQKRRIFLMATINRYSKELGLKEPYRW